MPPLRTQHPAAAKPRRDIFDPWNSISTGHQRADNILSGSTSWRESRTFKLGAQFRDGVRGGERVADTVGAGSENFGTDGRRPNGGWEKGASGLRGKGQRSIIEALGAKTTKPAVTGLEKRFDEDTRRSGDKENESVLSARREEILHVKRADASSLTHSANQVYPDQATPAPKQIFRNLTIYINGSTYPLISDHKLKQLLSVHGANISIALGRRTVTHVILGHPNGPAASTGTGRASTGAGGGLAGSKIQKEIARIGAKGVKFVSAEWVIESLKAGKRLPEARFECLRLAANGQGSVLDVMRKKMP